MKENSKNNNSENFFDWIVSLFKKKKVEVVKHTPTYQELAAEAKWINIKSQYSLEFLKEHNQYFVRYMHKRSGEWWYLRRWAEDYGLERARGNAIRVRTEEEFDQVIRLHQEWLNEGHIYMSFD